MLKTFAVSYPLFQFFFFRPLLLAFSPLRISHSVSYTLHVFVSRFLQLAICLTCSPPHLLACCYSIIFLNLLCFMFLVLHIYSMVSAFQLSCPLSFSVIAACRFSLAILRSFFSLVHPSSFSLPCISFWLSACCPCPKATYRKEDDAGQAKHALQHEHVGLIRKKRRETECVRSVLLVCCGSHAYANGTVPPN